MTNIEWTDETWNPTTGCAKVSAGCKNCYAEVMSNRLAAMNQEKYQDIMTEGGRFNGRVRTHDDALLIPLSWKKPRKVFVNSMSDLFHEDVPFEFIDWVFVTMALTPQHTYQILTKRPERMAEYFLRRKGIRAHGSAVNYEVESNMVWPLKNVWLGTSVENQEQADKRIEHLIHCPAAVRFLSCEPLVGAVDLWVYTKPWHATNKTIPIHWVIAGGESGPSARPMHPDWARSLRDQCAEAGIPFFFKQWGNWCAPDQYGHRMGDPSIESCKRHVLADGTEVFRAGKKAAGNVLDGRKHEEFPKTAPSKNEIIHFAHTAVATGKPDGL